MTRHRALLHLTQVVPLLLPGPVLHRAGLSALAAGEFDAADGLFEHAALAYRRELRVERLARVRVHQAIARARAGRVPPGGGDAALAIERALCALPLIESLEAPFEVVDARQLLASWDGERAGDLHAAA